MPLRHLAFLCLGLVLSCLCRADETRSLYLSGRGSDDAVEWDFLCTGGRNSGVWTKIRVPSCWEQEGFGTYEYGVESRGSERMPVRPPPPEERGFYRHTFHVPADWKGSAVRIVFEGVMTDTEVKVNGVVAGPIHQGSFYRFHYDITDKVKFGGPNLLEVAVSKRSANESVNKAERQADYWNFGGIFRPVRLEARPSSFVERVAINATAAGTFTADVFLGGKATRSGTVEVSIVDASDRLVAGPVSQKVQAGTSSVRVAASISDPALWTAESPHLYRAKFSYSTGGVRHDVTERFGFRTIEVRRGGGIFLNGKPIVLKGVNRHSFWADTGRTLSARRQREDVRLMKEANMNAVRMSHYPPDKEFLELCDEAGLYVLHELAGWQQSYDTPTGRRLIAQLVARDVNHPSVLFWANGNEGGENVENDDEFAKHDPQKRTVLHPWALSFRSLNTYHYREYADTTLYSDGPDIFMPTEFLHGLYDGGHGAGLEDYWKLLSQKPTAAGGFLWVWMDEAVVRTDLGGMLDANRDMGPDGMVGPRHEKEGSFFAVREIWCPVQIPLDELPEDFDGRLPVRNAYDFSNLSGVTFEWRLMRYGPPDALQSHRFLISHGRVQGPDIPARGTGELRIPLQKDWRDADTLQLTAIDSQARELWTWSWRWKRGASEVTRAFPVQAEVTLAEEGSETLVRFGRNAARFSRTTGLLVSLERDGRPISLGDGPRLAAYRRNNRILEPVASAKGRLLTFNAALENGSAVVVATHDGGVRESKWTISPDGDIRLEYAYEGPGLVDLLGIDFEYPEEKVQGKDWVGAGPYRVWGNRLRGGLINRWANAYNDTIPGVTWEFPEFKGWFSRWVWMSFTTTEGRFALVNDAGSPYVGVFAPRDGRNNPVLVVPRLGLGVYQVIPAIGTKQSEPSKLGPLGQPRDVTGTVRGSVVLRLLDKP